MNILFYIGIAVVILAYIPRFMLASWMIKQKNEYAKIPMKMDEIKAKYRTRRWILFIVQALGIVLALIGLG